MHENVQSIGEQCFSWNSKLREAEINTPNLNGSNILANCNKLTSVKFAPSTTVFPAGLLMSCSSLETVDVPENVTSFGIEAFNNCSSLTKLTIPEKVASIGNSCFFGCTNLGEINCLPEKAPSLGKEVFGNSTANNTGVNASDRNIYVRTNATGYESGDWKNVLSDVVGFTFNYTL